MEKKLKGLFRLIKQKNTAKSLKWMKCGIMLLEFTIFNLQIYSK